MAKKILIALALFSMLAVCAGASNAQPAAGTDKAAIQAQITGIDVQLKSIREELAGLNTQKEAIKDQISTLSAQKHIAGLNIRSQGLNTKIQDAQKANNTARAAELTEKLSLLTKEISIEQEILSLLTRLSDARKDMQKDKIQDLEAQIKSQKDSLKALYPPKPGQIAAVPPSGNAPAFASTPVAKTEDPDIQALLDKIKDIDTQIGLDKQKMADLKKQRDALKLQLK